MRLALDEWIDLQKKNIRTCDGNESIIPKTIFIGILQKNGTVESRVRLVSASEWEELQDPVCKDYLPPQFFLFYE